MSRISNLLALATNEQGQVKSGFKIIGFVLLSFFVLILASFVPFSGLMAQWVFVAGILGASWFCLKLEEESLYSIGLRLNSKFLLEFLSGTLTGVLLISLSALIIRLFGGFTWVRNTQVDLTALFYALIPFLGVSLFEELLFRGYAFQRAIRGLGSTCALLLFGFLFAVIHWGNPGMTGGVKFWGSLNIGLASVLLGLAWIKTGSLALPVGIHLGWNWAQGSLLGFGVSGHESQGFWTPVFSGLPQWFTGGDFGLEASLPGAVVCSIACIALAFWRQKPFHL